MKKMLLIVPFLFLIGLPTHSVAGWFGSDTYEECLLDEDVGDARTKEAVREIKRACKNRHPEYMWNQHLLSARMSVGESASNYSDCELVKRVQKNGNGKFSDKVLEKHYGINPSKCD